MSLIYLMLKRPKPNYLHYAIADTDAQLVYFTDSPATPLDFTQHAGPAIRSYWWALGCTTFDDFINHPDVIQFTRESHPELFI